MLAKELDAFGCLEPGGLALNCYGDFATLFSNTIAYASGEGRGLHEALSYQAA